MGLKVLCLTDHSVHSPHNSVYALCRGMLSDERVTQLDVASRGFEENSAFFNHQTSAEVWVSEVTKDFSFEKGEAQYKLNWMVKSVDDYDMIFIRFPYPVSDGFFDYLQKIAPDNKYVNRPSGITETSTKAFLFNFTEFCPPMQLCRSIDDIVAFSRVFPVVLKPLTSYGGRGVVKVKDGIVNPATDRLSLDEYFGSDHDQLPILAMKFLKNVTEGDRRTVVANGKVITSTTRFPAKGQWLCNVSQGGRGELSNPSAEELEMIEVLAPALLKKGVVVFGMDTLVGDDGKRKLSEINTLSIGGIYPSEIQSKIPYSKMVSQAILDYFTSH